MMNNHAQCIPGKSAHTSLRNQKKRIPWIPLLHDVITWHARSKEEKLTTMLIILSLLLLLFTL